MAIQHWDKMDSEEVFLFFEYKNSKVKFLKRLRQLSREYDDNEIAEVIKSTEVDYKSFWQALKKSRSNNMASVSFT